MYSFRSNIRYSEVDSDRNLTWTALLDYFQDCSFFHSEERGVGIDYLNENNLAWVLSYWQIKLNRMPQVAEMVETQTWPYDMKGFYGFRNFSMNDMSGNRFAYANSIWVLIDTKTGLPSKVQADIKDAYEYDEKLEMGQTSRKIKIPADYEVGEHVIVPTYFIDTNKHMNNSKYVELALGFVKDDFEIRELRAEYKKSAMLGDEIIPHITYEDDQITVVLTATDGAAYAIVQFLK